MGHRESVSREAAPVPSSGTEEPFSAYSNSELGRLLKTSTDTKTIDAAKAALRNRILSNPELYLGIVISPTQIEAIGTKVAEFLRSAEGKAFLKKSKSKYFQKGDTIEKAMARMKREFAKDLRAAIKDSPLGPPVNSLLLNQESLDAVAKELGFNRKIHLGIFLPEEEFNKASQEALEAVLQSFRDEIVSAITEAAMERAQSKGAFVRNRTDAVAEAASQAANDILDGTTSPRQWLRPVYNGTYKTVFPEVKSRLDAVRSTIGTTLGTALDGFMDPGPTFKNLTADVIVASPPMGMEAFPKNPYAALYDREVKTDGSIERKTYIGAEFKQGNDLLNRLLDAVSGVSK